jgi:GTPase-associated protein 1, N-terminal domain type 2/GTPase-associated protein 1, middle domain
MTAQLFDRLLYTDCKPGTGRGAGGGFQVQAQSVGVDSAQSQLAVGSLLYEVQLPWLTDRRPVDDFPRGFAHAGGEGYGTAQSRYLGKVATGGRDGNHLADCLLTRDPDLYGPLRPAQLWRWSLWRAEPWDDRDCPQLDAAELEPGPLTVDAVADWVRAVPERGPALARLLSVLEEPGGRHVVIVADDADEAMAWIAAATLLLPSRDALEVSFKVFSSRPLDATHRVVAVPAALFPKIAPGMAGRRFVLDARTSDTDEAQTSERAAFFAGRFTAEQDPYDVVDAVELDAALGGGPDARHTAWALTRPDDTITDPDALFRWLSSTGPGLLSEHGPAVAAMILQSSPPTESLRWIDAAVSDKRLPLEPAAVRVQLLRAELADARSGRGALPAEILPAVPLDASAHRDAESELSSAILLGSDQQVDRLLGLGHRHGIEPELAPPLQQRLRDFVSGWIDRPGTCHPDGWVLRAEVLDCAHDELRHRVSAVGVAGLTDTIRRLSRYFGDRADLTDPVDCHIQASLIAVGSRTERMTRLRQLLAGIAACAQSPATADTAAAASAGLQRALIQWDAVDGEVAVGLLSGLPDSLDVEPEISDRAVERLARMSDRPSRALVELLVGLDKRGRAPTSGPLVKVLQADRYVRTFTSRAVENRLVTDGTYFHSTVRLLTDISSMAVRARLDDVLAACLDSPHPDLAPVVLASVRLSLARLLVERWANTLGTRDPVQDGLWCVRCLSHQDLPPELAEQLWAAVRDYARTLPLEDQQTWYEAVKRKLGQELRGVWYAVFTQEMPRARSRLRLHRDGGR